MSSDSTNMILVGIGGGGCRLAAAAKQAFGNGMTAIGFDTDEVAIRCVEGLRCHLIGATRLNKQGSGGIHSNGRLAAQDDLSNILEQLRDARIVVIATCLGGGTGGGATPVILKALHDAGKITLCFATRPFAFEGPARQQNAERDRPFLVQTVDTLVDVPLDELYTNLGALPLVEAVKQADLVMAGGLCLLWRLLLTPGFIHFDAVKLQNLLIGAGSARFGHVSASGESRAGAAVAALARAPLLRNGEALGHARALALGILAGSDIRLAEIGDLMKDIRAACRKDVHIEMGVVADPLFDGRIELVALAFESWVPADRRSGRSSGDGQHLGDLLGKRGQDAKLGAGANKFNGVEKTVHNGEDLDIPTYQRRFIRLER